MLKLKRPKDRQADRANPDKIPERFSNNIATRWPRNEFAWRPDPDQGRERFEKGKTSRRN